MRNPQQSLQKQVNITIVHNKEASAYWNHNSEASESGQCHSREQALNDFALFI